MQDEEIFQTIIPELAWFRQGGWRIRQKPYVAFTRQFPRKSCSTTHLPFLSSNPKILKAFTKTFPTEMRQKNREDREYSVSKFCRLSAYTRTIFCLWISNLDQKAAKCTTCKRFCGNFSLFIAWQWRENGSTSFKTWFSAKFPGVNELIDSCKLYLKKSLLQRYNYSHLFALIWDINAPKDDFKHHHVLISSDY